MDSISYNNRLEVKNVSKTFGKLQVLDNIDFVAEPAEFVSIVGTSGCGNSSSLWSRREKSKS